MATTKNSKSNALETTGADAQSKVAEAKSKFNSALDEAKAGAAALGDSARSKAGEAKAQALETGSEWAAEAKLTAAELAEQGKSKAVEALTSLSRVAEENAALIDEKFGAKYGDYVRSASQSLHGTAQTLEQKSYEELGEDAREVVRNNPLKSVGIAALVGFALHRLLRRR